MHYYYHSFIRDAGLKAQNYDKGFDRFIRRFKPDLDLAATVAIFKGVHDDHGTAVLCTHGKRR
jgi:hypothetical protein